MVAAGILTTGNLSAGTLTWTGAESQNWNLNDVNWTNELGEATAWVNGNDAIFPRSAASPVTVDGDVELRNLNLLYHGSSFKWYDGGGSLTFVSDGANPTNYISLGDDVQHHELRVRVSCEAPLVKDGDAVLYLSNPGNSLRGGLIQTKSQLRVVNSGAVGPGPVTMLGSSTVFNHDAPVAPDVKFIQNSSTGANQLGSIGPTFTIKSVGTTADNTTRTFRIGRGSGACDIVLSLTDPESEGIGQYILNGSSSTFTFDGGVVKAAPETKDLFFTTRENAIPAARVTNNGVTFDTAGASTELGLSLTFDGSYLATNVVETVYPKNWSFEDAFGSSDWTVNKGSNTASSSSQSNDGAFMNDSSSNHQEAYCTTNGSHFAAVRNRHTISQTVNLPAAGLWRVVYERGCRPHSSYYGCEFEVTVTLGDAANATVSPAQATPYVFRREETAWFALEAGNAVLSFAVSADSEQNRGVLLDAVRLERCEIVTIPVGPFVKTGAGTLVVTNLLTEGLIAVSNGTLVTKRTVLDGPSVDVADGGTFELWGARLTNATVNVAAGGTLSLRENDPRNLVANGSFEVDVLDNASVKDRYALYSSGTGPEGWTFRRKAEATETSGIQANGSDISNKDGGISTEFGQQTAYIRGASELSQTVRVPAAGEYDVSFVHACRLGYDSYTISLSLLIDGVEVASGGTHTANYGFERCTARVNLTAGDHTIKFSTGSTSVQYAALFIDDVRLTAVMGHNTLDGSTFAFESGATLDLEDEELIYLAGGVTVDGVTVKGDANALRRAGVYVAGSGAIQIGPPQGTVILFK